ncbi:hypothetical protein C8R45DRAFT_1087788 [Mycena sanguinolenta]|nr:hypothetical protein C8R45DRAFT_1087788 [Mycena sanguinolenta]
MTKRWQFKGPREQQRSIWPVPRGSLDLVSANVPLPIRLKPHARDHSIDALQAIAAAAFPPAHSESEYESITALDLTIDLRYPIFPTAVTLPSTWTLTPPAASPALRPRLHALAASTRSHTSRRRAHKAKSGTDVGPLHAEAERIAIALDHGELERPLGDARVRGIVDKA